MIFLLLWTIWKARNNLTFNNKNTNPLQVLQAAKAIFEAQKQEQNTSTDNPQGVSLKTPHFTSLRFDRDKYLKNPNLFTDAAWKDTTNSSVSNAGCTKKAGLGIFLHWPSHKPKKAVFIKATSQADSPLQAEAQSLELASVIAKTMEISEPNFLTDNQILAESAARRNVEECPGHWKIKPYINQYIKNTSSMRPSVFKIKRDNNKAADKLADRKSVV